MKQTGHPQLDCLLITGDLTSMLTERGNAVDKQVPEDAEHMHWPGRLLEICIQLVHLTCHQLDVAGMSCLTHERDRLAHFQKAGLDGM